MLIDVTAPPLDDPMAEFEIEPPDISQIVIEDDAPMDNMLQEKEARLLTEPLYSSWEGPPPREDGARRPFLAGADVGLFATTREPPLVPDVFLSLDVHSHPDLQKEKRHQTYFFWELGKPPDVVIEIVSDRRGDELGRKKRGYAHLRVLYYAVWDPMALLGTSALSCFELRGDLYVPLGKPWFEAAQLGLTLWRGKFEEQEGEWLRWCREDGSLIPTGAERADRAEVRAERMADKLRALGIDPEER